jgi:O-antigen ligase
MFRSKDALSDIGPGGALAFLPLVGALALLLPLAILIARGDWNLLAGLGLGVLVLYSLVIRPYFLTVTTLAVFLATAMPVVNRGGVLTQLRWAMLFALAFALLLNSAIHGTGSSWHSTHVSLALFVAFALISSFYSPNSLMTLLKAASFGSLVVAALLYGSLECRQGAGGRYQFLDALYWCTVLVALGCALSYLHILPQRGGGSPGRYFPGLFGNPNSLGAFISLVAPVLLLRIFGPFRRGVRERQANVVLAIGFLLFLLMSRSRAGISGTALACAWWLYFSYRKAFRVFLGCVFVCGVVTWAYFPGYLKSLDEVYVKKGGAYVLESREELWRASWEAAKESPVIGVGFGAARGYSEDWEVGFETGGATREKGNSYLAVIEEVGVIGLGLLLAPVAWALKRAADRLPRLRTCQPPPAEFWSILTLSACVLGGLGNAFSEAWLTSAGFFSAVVLWMAFGVLASRLVAPLPGASSE